MQGQIVYNALESDFCWEIICSSKALFANIFTQSDKEIYSGFAAGQFSQFRLAIKEMILTIKLTVAVLVECAAGKFLTFKRWLSKKKGKKY